MTRSDHRRRVAALCGDLALLADIPPEHADMDTPLLRVLRHLAAARDELDAIIAAQPADSLEFRFAFAALHLEDALIALEGDES
jgi:hypothetical protein